MTDYTTYGFTKTATMLDVTSMERNIAASSKYDVILTNQTNESFIKISEVGDVELFANDMCCIKVVRNGRKVNVYANKINLNGDTTIKSMGSSSDSASIQVSSDNTIGKVSTDVSLIADNIGINCFRSTFIGDKEKTSGGIINLSIDKLNIDANSILVNGKEYVPQV